MEVRKVNRPDFEYGYLGPSPRFTGVCDFLPYLTVSRFANGGGCVSIGWLFWYAGIVWKGAK